MKRYTLRFEDVGIKDVARVGGKNASLGEMIRELSPKGVRVPGGFIVTADAYRYFLRKTGLREDIAEILKDLDTKNLSDLARRGALIRNEMKSTKLPDDLEAEI